MPVRSRLRLETSTDPGTQYLPALHICGHILDMPPQGFGKQLAVVSTQEMNRQVPTASANAMQTTTPNRSLAWCSDMGQ